MISDDLILDVKTFEGLYEVDRDGNVYSIRRRRKLKPYVNNSGYLKVDLYYFGMKQKKYVHRIVAEAFIKNPHKKEIVNHKDGNRKNNNVENLEWMTQSENMLHCVRNGRHVNNLPKYRGGMYE